MELLPEPGVNALGAENPRIWETSVSEQRSSARFVILSQMAVERTRIDSDIASDLLHRALP